jgi:hypothetical protein
VAFIPNIPSSLGAISEFDKAITELLRRGAGELSSRIQLLIEDMLTRWLALDERIAAFDAEFAVEAKRDEAARGLTSIPGIGALNATAHNAVMHTIDMRSGVNGFRAWTDTEVEVPAGFVKCPCGWSGLPHYASRGHVKATKGKCATWAQIKR